MSMRFALIVGSHRSGGTSDKVVRLIEDHLRSRGAALDVIALRDFRIEGCDSDNACEHALCGLDDDMRKIVDRMLAADGLIYLPVIHAYGTNSLFQKFLERAGFGFFRPMERPLRDKVATVVVVGRRYAHTSIFSQIVLNLLLNKTILVGSGFPGLFFSDRGEPEADAEGKTAVCDSIDRMIEIHNRLQGRPAAVQG